MLFSDICNSVLFFKYKLEKFTVLQISVLWLYFSLNNISAEVIKLLHRKKSVGGKYDSHNSK